jgi:DNA-binding GntR family transcriptional regulator
MASVSPRMSIATGQPASKQEWTYSVLRSRIVNGTYGAGHRLVIDAIARELEVSPMPVREAIRRLEAEGWVQYQRNHGASVSPLEDEAWAEAMDAVAVLDGYATALAAPHLRPEDLELMRAANERMRAALDEFDVVAVSEHNLAFHRAVQDRCPNHYLRLELRSTQERLNTLRGRIFMFIPGRGRASTGEHDELIAMLEGGRSAGEIEAFARRHTQRTVEVYLQRRAEMESA